MVDPVMEQVRSEVSGHEAMAYLRAIYEHDRWSSFSEYHKSCEFCADAMRTNGLTDVELVEVPADGRTKFGDWEMPK